LGNEKQTTSTRKDDERGNMREDLRDDREQKSPGRNEDKH